MPEDLCRNSYQARICSDENEAMTVLARMIPHTPLDTLRALLGEYSGDDNSFRSQLANLLQRYRKQIVGELGRRLCETTTPKGIRRGILAQVARFDWPEWCPHLFAAMHQEPDLGVFDEGCAALGVLATREAFEALKQLQGLRNDPDRQTILNRELALFRPQMTVDHYINRLLEGQGNPKLAAQGAKALAAGAGPGDVPALIEAFHHGDVLAQRLVLRLMGSIRASEAEAFLVGLLDTGREEFLDHQMLAECLRRIQPLQRASLKPELLRQVGQRFQPRVSETAACLERAAAIDGAELSGELDPLKAVASGACDRALLECLSLLVEGKFARFSAYVQELSESTDARISQLHQHCDAVAEALAYRMDIGASEPGALGTVLLQALRAHMGSEGFIQAFLFHLPITEASVLDELLADSDMDRRQRYLNALGSREDDALVGFFLKAMQDPIVEVGLLATHHLGKLPSSFPALMSLLESGQVEQVRLAIRVFGENQVRAAAEPLLALMQKDTRDDLLVDAAEALAKLAYGPGASILLDLLHDGKPLNLQIALAKALGAMATPEASLGLLSRSTALKQSQVLVLCLEGALSAFNSFDHPMPGPKVPELLALAERCFDEREGEGQRLRAMLGMHEFYAFDSGAYEKLKERFSDFLFHMRTKENWDRESNDKVAAVIKELTRRSTSLGLIAQKESHIRSQIQYLPEMGPKRVETLLALRDALQDPELIIRPELAQELSAFVLRELGRPTAEWRETAHLCEIGGLSHREELCEPIRDVYLRATGLGLKSAARGALLALGLSEADLNRRAPIQTILVLEPSGFFRKRILSTLGATGLWKLSEAAGRHEADALLDAGVVDLILAEGQDAEGELGSWLEAGWRNNRFRHALLSTANRDLGVIADAPWLLGVLFKPYPFEQLLRALEA